MRRAPLLLLSFVFFLSGVAALIFEALWFRQAGLTFGGSVWASALVLSSFMAGLAMGNGLAARFGSRLRRPIVFYAALELVIGIAGFGLVLLLPVATPAVAKLLGPILDSTWLLRLARFSVAFVLLMGPAVAMGATLPVLVRAFGGGGSDFGRVLGRLYGINTLGAVVGAVSSEMLWIPALGVIGSGCVAAGFNAISAGLALVAARAAPRLEMAEPAARGRAGGERIGLTPARLLIAAFLSGTLLLALEVVWFRMLVLFVPQTSTVFAWMLAVVLAGIAIGGLLSAALLWLRDDLDRFVAAVACLSGLATVCTYTFFPRFVVRFANTRAEDPLAILPLALGLMLPTSLLSGVLFIWLGRRLHAEIGSDVRSAGLLTLANTLGSMLGPLAASFVLLPRLGTEYSVWLLSVGYGGVAVCALGWASVRASTLRWVVHVVAAVAFGWSITAFPFGTMAGLYLKFVEDATRGTSEELIAFREGVNETIGYTRTNFLGEPYWYRLLTDGYSMTGTILQSQRYMSLFAYLPYAFHAAPRDALLISYGVGITARALTEEPSLERIDVVDISRDILEMSYVTEGGRPSPLDDPRVEVHIEDGRYFLQTVDREYDIITGEPPPPAVAGVVNLYTREYFDLLRSRLRPGGIVSYWLPVFQLAEPDARAIVAAFCGAFADCTLWEGTPTDWILLGTRDVVGPLDEAAIARQWEHPERSAALARIGIENPQQLGALFLGDSAFLVDWAGDALPLVDNWPDRAPRWATNWRRGVPTGGYADIMNEFSMRQRFEESEFIARLWPESLRRESLEYFWHQRLAGRHLFGPVRALQIRELHRLLTETTLETLPLWLLGSNADRHRIAAAATPSPATDEFIAYHRGVQALARRDYAEAARLLDDVSGQRLPRGPYFALYAHAMAGDLAAVQARARVVALSEGISRRSFWSFMQAEFGLAEPNYLGNTPKF